MKILVANLGSTSMKHSLYAMDGGQERLVARGGQERITDYAAAVDECLRSLIDEGHLSGLDELAAVGFKPVVAQGVSGCVEMTESVLAAMEAFSPIAPAHNPPYINGVRMFREKAPGAPLVGLFETAFYQWIPEANTRFAVPEEWRERGVRRFGFHGASHKYIAERSAELLGREDVAQRAQRLYRDGGTSPVAGPDLRVISCHLGGSSSVTGIRNGVAIGNSFGMTPQSGLPHNNRVGDLDPCALPYLMRETGLSLDEAERIMTKESGLLGMSGVSNDVRDLREAAEQGNQRARIALDVLVAEIRRYVGWFYLELNGIDALAFTAGIGENDGALRREVCAKLENLGIRLDAEKAAQDRWEQDAVISAEDSPVKVMVIHTNEELVIAREVKRKLEATG
ncbi:acetate/propionate family kinase [Candidatus Sumerlaeota bacterium]|nr:acetate/propionate family kinase [Candidatus Sumerlaeota bacterium]